MYFSLYSSKQHDDGCVGWSMMISSSVVNFSAFFFIFFYFFLKIRPVVKSVPNRGIKDRVSIAFTVVPVVSIRLYRRQTYTESLYNTLVLTEPNVYLGKRCYLEWFLLSKVVHGSFVRWC